MQRVWFLNFDADLELAAPGGYTSSHAVRARQAAIAMGARGLVPPGDVVIDDDGRAPSTLTHPTEGRAFCPTPRAWRAWRLSGVARPVAPSLDVLRRVNHRAFSAELGATLPGARFCVTMTELDEALLRSSADWLLKPAFGFAGRGQQRVLSGQLDRAARSFAERAFARGHGLQVEPLVERVLDVAAHGFVTPSGAAVLGEPTGQTIDARGAWLASARLLPGALDSAERDQLLHEARRVAGALASAGYFGPFGIDGFRWRDTQGAQHFNPRCEINARYSMGWATGMGEQRPDLLPAHTW